MLSIGIKNAILIILIILIIHFAIKQIIMTKEDRAEITPEKKEKFTADILPYATQASNTQEPKCMPQSPNDNLESEKDNLLKFVFGDNVPKGSKGLDDFFKDYSNQISQCDKPYEVCNNKKSDDHTVPLQSTCDPKIQELPLTPEFAKAKEVCNTKRDLMILNEYKNENPMNGGALYGDINAFDDFDQSYSQLG
jgi:hypothetical protein